MLRLFGLLTIYQHSHGRENANRHRANNHSQVPRSPSCVTSLPLKNDVITQSTQCPRRRYDIL